MSATTKDGKPRRRVSPGAPVSERILFHTDRSGDCWLWMAHVSAGGYGRITLRGRSGYYAHRVSYETFVGPIPTGLEIDHLCRVRRCVNPDHLEPVTPQINTLRGTGFASDNAAKTHCPQGHEYNAQNTYGDKRRYCRPCRRAYMRLYNALSVDEVQHRRESGLPLVDLDGYFAARRRQDVAA